MTKRKSLRQLIDSERIEDKFAAGSVLAEILDPQLGLVDRKQESLRFHARNINERSIELELDPTVLVAAEKRLRVTLDSVPITLIPKGLYHRFQVVGPDGDPESLITRRTNARVAQCHLIWFAVNYGDLDLPSVKVSEVIGLCAGQFPVTPQDVESEASEPVVKKSHADRLDIQEDKDWWESALNVPGWDELRASYEERFLVIVRNRIDTSRASAFYRIEVLENRTATGPNTLQSEVLGKPKVPTRKKDSKGGLLSKSLAFPISQIGRARSDYIHLEAPDGTFFGNVIPVQLADLTDSQAAALAGQARTPSAERKVLGAYRIKLSRRSATLYLRRRSLWGSEKPVTLLANLWPDPDGFLTPLRIWAYYIAAACIPLFVLQLNHQSLDWAFMDQLRADWMQTNPNMEDLNQSLQTKQDLLITLVLFLPTVVVTWIFRMDEPLFRKLLVKKWRRLALLGLVALGASYLAFFGFGQTSGSLALMPLGICAVFAAVFLVRVEHFSWRLLQASENTRSRETGSLKGLGVRTTETELTEAPLSET